MPQNEWIYSRLKTLPVWERFVATANPAQQTMVRECVEYAAPILSRVIETFPTYTLHNHVHAENVVELMGKLLGERVEDLNALEAALLILSAYFHDIGMVFDENARNSLKDEHDFAEFLEKNPQADIAQREEDELPLDIAEWYCRWSHADRVFHYLDELGDEKFKWGTISLRVHLGELCRSHNRDVATLKGDEFRTDLAEGGDLRFCAVLLRLADILDFDNSRSPDSVYEYLGLSRRTDKRAEASDVEWRKHLCSDGFIFPDDQDRTKPYSLRIVAGPDKPEVEHDMREFLKVIEGELAKCGQILRHCSDRWRTIELPSNILREDIQGKNYTYGAHRFHLDQDQVLDLFMGENLYDNPHVFVRELLQNAIDTSRFREYREKSMGNADYAAEPIQVSEWRDRKGYQWMRIDDYGMGMTQEIINDHLLKVGNSYYTSPSFDRDVLQYTSPDGRAFKPISRFGIGLLSCFIACDRIELSTWHIDAKDDQLARIRLSFEGLHGFFTLQSGRNLPEPMPIERGEGEGYRTRPGTSIALRLDPRKDAGTFDLRNLLDKHLLCPPVPFLFEGQPIGGDPEEFLDKPWTSHLIIELTPDETKKLEGVLDNKFTEPIRVHLAPIDLTKQRQTHELKGQLAILCVESREVKHVIEAFNAKKHDQDYCGVHLEIKDGRLELSSYWEVERGVRNCRLDLTRIFDQLSNEALNRFCGASGRRSWLAHNGIAFAGDKDGDIQFDNFAGLYLRASEIFACGTLVIGYLALYDSLRAHISVSRGSIMSFPLEAHSVTTLATREALKSESYSLFSSDSLEVLNVLSHRTQALVMANTEDVNHLSLWEKQTIIRCDGTARSIEELLSLVRSQNNIRIQCPIEVYMWLNAADHEKLEWHDVAAMTLIQKRLNPRAVPSRSNSGPWELVLKSGEPVMKEENLRLFRPLFFVPYETDKLLRSENAPLNYCHPFSQWLIANAERLRADHAALFEQIARTISGNRKFVKADELASLVNETLDHLKSLRGNFAPPVELALSEDDFQFTPASSDD